MIIDIIIYLTNKKVLNITKTFSVASKLKYLVLELKIYTKHKYFNYLNTHNNNKNPFKSFRAWVGEREGIGRGLGRNQLRIGVAIDFLIKKTIHFIITGTLN